MPKVYYIIITSAAEYVTGYQLGCMSTVPNINRAKRFATEAAAREVLRPIKARIDSGAIVERMEEHS